MFDIGFFELVIIGVIALLVLGPERLPHAVRMTSAWLGKFRRAAMTVREEIEREVNAYEVQERIKEQIEKSGMKDAKEMLEETQQALRNGILDESTLKEIENRGLEDYTKSLAEPSAAEALESSSTHDKAQAETDGDSTSQNQSQTTANSSDKPT
ncbi:MAG: Sec-independent protein translocase protein TatB [Pseudomonadales bacterium]|nr:Sec-independent protein translocase protein TatB [Pseudomonadales bacterium]